MPMTGARRADLPSRCWPRQRGLTLTGLLVGLAISTIVLASALGAYGIVMRGARENMQGARLNQELHAALEVMTRDLRRAGFWAPSANGTRTQLTDLALGNAAGQGFDANQDGHYDATDLAPTANPFQRRYGRINTDLCIATDPASGTCQGSTTCNATDDVGNCIDRVDSGNCITFSYDLDRDGRVGIRSCSRDAAAGCSAPPSAPFDASGGAPFAWRPWSPSGAPRDLEMELFGYQLQQSRIRMRVGRTDPTDTRFGCGSGRWESITSPEIEIRALRFTLRTLIRNATPDKSATAACASGDTCRQIRSVAIRIQGRLPQTPEIEQTLYTEVMIPNHRLDLTP